VKEIDMAARDTITLVTALRVNAKSGREGTVLIADSEHLSHGQLAEQHGYQRREVAFGLERMYADKESGELLTPRPACERLGVPWDGRGDSWKILEPCRKGNRFLVRKASPDDPIYTRGFMIGGRYPKRAPTTEDDH
jgi:hypothetical protein